MDEIINNYLNSASGVDFSNKRDPTTKNNYFNSVSTHDSAYIDDEEVPSFTKKQ